MRFKLDENLPTALAKLLVDHGHDADTVHDEGLVGRDDAAVARAAQKADRFLMTQDVRFASLRSLIGEDVPGVLLLRLREPGRASILARMRAVIESFDVEKWKGALVVVSDRKVRIRRP